MIQRSGKDHPGTTPEEDPFSGPSFYDHADLDRLGLAVPLLGATGWIDGLAKLVAIDTSAAPEASARAYADALQDMFAPLGFSFRRVQTPAEESPRGRRPAAAGVNIIAGRRTGRRVCTLYFDTDTITAGEDWTRPAFALTRQSSRLYGRGTTGMKGAIAAVWAALRAADAVGLGLGYDPVLIFCSDREESQHAGLRHLISEGLVEGHVVCLDGPAAPRIWAGSLGSIRLAVTVSGTEPIPLHAAMNPIEAMAPVLARLTRLKEAIEARHPEPQDDLAPALSVSSVRGGVPGAEWPETCSLMLHRSYTVHEGFDAPLAEMEAAVREGFGNLPHLQLSTMLVAHCPPVYEPARGPNAARWKQAIGWGFGYPAAKFRRWSSREGSPMGFVQQAGISEILLGGLRRPSCTAHGPDEFTTVEDVEALARSLLAYLAEVAEIPSY